MVREIIDGERRRHRIAQDDVLFDDRFQFERIIPGGHGGRMRRDRLEENHFSFHRSFPARILPRLAGQRLSNLNI